MKGIIMLILAGVIGVCNCKVTEIVSQFLLTCSEIILTFAGIRNI